MLRVALRMSYSAAQSASSQLTEPSFHALYTASDAEAKKQHCRLSTNRHTLVNCKNGKKTHTKPNRRLAQFHTPNTIVRLAKIRLGWTMFVTQIGETAKLQ